MAGKPSLLTDKRQKQLEKMGFIFNRWDFEFAAKGIEIADTWCEPLEQSLI
jgi:hypothetical protein